MRNKWQIKNVVKLFEFDDGVKWVARFRLSEKVPPSVEDLMKSEIATHNYLRYVILGQVL